MATQQQYVTKVYVRNGKERVFTANELRNMGPTNQPEKFGWVEKDLSGKTQLKPTGKQKRSLDFGGNALAQMKSHCTGLTLEQVEKFFEGDTRDAVIALSEDILNNLVNA